MPAVFKTPEEMPCVPPMPGSASYVLCEAQKEIERLRDEIKRLRAEIDVLRAAESKDGTPIEGIPPGEAGHTTLCLERD